jgi:hypothetical protein
MIHDSDVNNSWHKPQENTVDVELLEVGNQGRHSKASENNWSVLENVAQLLVQSTMSRIVT